MALLAIGCSLDHGIGADLPRPLAGPDLVFAEHIGRVAVEAEHFYRQSLTDTRAWHIVSPGNEPAIEPDGDPVHLAGASGGAYLEILPDSRRNHDEELIHGENFSNEPGKLGVLHYKVHFETPGRYYVWVRAYSTGTEDNGIHVGLNGEWPESGRRMQWCEGKNGWRWESKQRTAEEHCGVPHAIHLDIPSGGEHEILFSMREDGFEFDKFILTRDRDFDRPVGPGPVARVKRGNVPESFAAVSGDAQRRTFPAHWGEPPAIQTHDYRPLPGNYGFGSSTLAAWIQKNLDQDAARPQEVTLKATDFGVDGTGYYVDRGQWLAIDPEQREEARTATAFPHPTGRYHVTLHAVGENDGRSTYQVAVNGDRIGTFECPLSTQTYEEGAKFTATFENVAIGSGDVIEVSSKTASNDGEEFSRARWSKLVFAAADAATRTALALAATAEPAHDGEDGAKLFGSRQPDGDGSVEIGGERRQWHNVVLTLNGPYAHEQDREPNPFTDYNFTVTFRHESGAPVYTVPGYFAADGDAANSSAESGTKWRAHLSPDKTGQWSYTVSFLRAKNVALQTSADPEVLPYSGRTGTFEIEAGDKRGRDFRAQGRLQYVGERYLKFAGSGDYFLKAGADAPETLLAYSEFDNTTVAPKQNAPLKTWEPHVRDWREGDPVWRRNKGKGLIGALNYLAGTGANAFSFLPYNAGGDGDNIWPFVSRDEKFHYDVSKLAQWGVVFEHANSLGLYLHFKMQENEMDDDRLGQNSNPGNVPESLDGGKLGLERKLYCRELIARFGHNLALNWNIGEENTQSTEEIADMVKFIHDTDPYDHHIVIHTFPNQQDKVYAPLLGNNSLLTGASLQNEWNAVHQRTLKWINESRAAGRPWVVANDEQGPANQGVPPDPGYEGFDGWARGHGDERYDLNDIRKYTLWANLMAGGAGVEYYFGYQLPQNDLVAEDWRSRDRTWNYCRIALEFFHENEVPFWAMTNANALIDNPGNSNDRYCFAQPGELYLVYLPEGGSSTLDLGDASGRFSVKWFNPREGGALQDGSVRRVSGGEVVQLGDAPGDPREDWLVVVRR